MDTATETEAATKTKPSLDGRILAVPLSLSSFFLYLSPFTSTLFILSICSLPPSFPLLHQFFISSLTAKTSASSVAEERDRETERARQKKILSYTIGRGKGGM